MKATEARKLTDKARRTEPNPAAVKALVGHAHRGIRAAAAMGRSELAGPFTGLRGVHTWRDAEAALEDLKREGYSVAIRNGEYVVGW